MKAETATYTGKDISIVAATKTGSTGKVTYTYYTNSDCSTRITNANSGVAATGGAPVKAGTYYVKAIIAADANYTAKTSAIVKLVINKAANKITAANFIKTASASGAQTFSIDATRLGGSKEKFFIKNIHYLLSETGCWIQ